MYMYLHVNCLFQIFCLPQNSQGKKEIKPSLQPIHVLPKTQGLKSDVVSLQASGRFRV